MPLFEDDTLEGAIKKATLGLGKNKFRSPSRTSKLGRTETDVSKQSRIPARTETFDNLRYGSRIGSGRGGFGSVIAAARAAASEMGHAAGNAYPDRVTAIKRGERQRSVMIPELAARILVDDWREIESGRERYSYDGLYVGRRYADGSGEFEIPGSANVTGLVHAHWVDHRASSDDLRYKTSLRNNVRRARGRQHGPVAVSFYILSLRGGLSSY